MKVCKLLFSFTVSIAIATLALSTSVFAETDKMLRLESKHAVIYHPRGLEHDAVIVEGIIEDVAFEVKEALGFSLDYRPGIVLITDKSAFESATGNSYISAYALSDKGLIVMDYQRVLTKPFTLKGTLKHEYIHLVLGRNLKTQIPRWLNEGVAQIVSDGPAEMVLSRNTSILIGASLSNRMIPLGDLGDSFPRPKRGMILAYEESLSFLRFIKAEFGNNAIKDILNRMATGEDVHSALSYVTGEGLNELEARWMGDLKRKASWISYFSNHFYELLFILAALLTIFGFLRVIIRIKTYRDEDEDEDDDETYLKVEEDNN